MFNFVQLGLLLDLRFRWLRYATLAMVAGQIAIAVFALQNIDVYYDLTSASFIPAYFRSSPGASLGWAWIAFVLAPILFYAAADLVKSDPTQEEHSALIGRWKMPESPRRNAALPVPSAPAFQNLPAVPDVPMQASPQPSFLTAALSASPPMAPATPPVSLPADVGICAACGSRNSMRATRCHACGATLPWESEKLEKQAAAAQVAAARKAEAAQMGRAAGDAGMTSLLYFLVIVLCFSVSPLVGFFIWKWLDSQESKYAGAAFTGWILGAAVLGIAFLARFLLIMSAVGSHS
jgi:hypothetical protein